MEASGCEKGRRGNEHTTVAKNLLRSRPLARHTSERGYCADAVIRPTRIARLVVLATLGICADASAVLVESLNDAAVRAVREVALAVGAGLDGEGHGQQGNGKGGDADHCEDFGSVFEEVELWLKQFNEVAEGNTETRLTWLSLPTIIRPREDSYVLYIL